VLAAIAIPLLLGQRAKAEDADAKSNARNAYSLVEACGAEAGGDYTDCRTPEQLGERSIPMGAAPGQVQVRDTGASRYTITANSRTGKTFVITKSPAGRTLTIGGTGAGNW
jgi:type IV pilus assembly protein PilA